MGHHRWTFVATAFAAVCNGATPVLLEVDPGTLTCRRHHSTSHRRALVGRHARALATIDGVEPVPTTVKPGAADHLRVVLVPEGVDSDRVIATPVAAGVATGIHFQPLHRFCWFGRRAHTAPGGRGRRPRRRGPLPLHPALTSTMSAGRAKRSPTPWPPERLSQFG